MNRMAVRRVMRLQSNQKKVSKKVSLYKMSREIGNSQSKLITLVVASLRKRRPIAVQ